MSSPMVIAYHLIWTGYGWWLPNDPRGSMSKCIQCDVIAELGELHYDRKSVQPSGRTIRQFYDDAREVLKFPMLEFDMRQIGAIAEAFGETVKRERYTCYACAIMPDHIHALIRKHRDQAEDMIIRLQDASRSELRRQGACPEFHPVWGGPGWKVFLHTPEDVRRTIRYIENNPIKGRMLPQRWEFVREYDDWPFHAGHSPNSPYEKRLRRGNE